MQASACLSGRGGRQNTASYVRLSFSEAALEHPLKKKITS